MKPQLSLTCSLLMESLLWTPTHQTDSNTTRFILFVCVCVFLGPHPDIGSQGRGQIIAVAGSLHHSHRNAGSEPCLQTIPQLMAMPDP